MFSLVVVASKLLPAAAELECLCIACHWMPEPRMWLVTRGLDAKAV